MSTLDVVQTNHAPLSAIDAVADADATPSLFRSMRCHAAPCLPSIPSAVCFACATSMRDADLSPPLLLTPDIFRRRLLHMKTTSRRKIRPELPPALFCPMISTSSLPSRPLTAFATTFLPANPAPNRLLRYAIFAAFCFRLRAARHYCPDIAYYSFISSFFRCRRTPIFTRAAACRPPLDMFAQRATANSADASSVRRAA